MTTEAAVRIEDRNRFYEEVKRCAKLWESSMTGRLVVEPPIAVFGYFETQVYCPKYKLRAPLRVDAASWDPGDITQRLQEIYDDMIRKAQARYGPRVWDDYEEPEEY